MREARRAKITKRVVDAARPGAARYVVWDAELSGFGLRVEPSGVKSYLVRYRGEGGGRQAPQRFLSLGRHGVLTPDMARQMAQSTLAAVTQGGDPVEQRSIRRAEPTVGEVLDRYLSDHVAHHNKRDTMQEARRHVERNIKPAFGRIRIGDLTRADIKQWHTAFSQRPYEGNRALAALRKALNLACLDWELRPDNPATGVKPFPEVKRERFYSDDEMRRIGLALVNLESDGAIPIAHSRCIRLMALTGMRLSEVLGLQWDWLDAEHQCFRLPDAKRGARPVTLGAPVLAYLTSLERTGPYICPGPNNDRPLGKRQFYEPWQKVVAAAQLDNARPHDFRHTIGTYSAQTGANAFLVRDSLGHKTMAMTGRYVSRNVDPLKALADEVGGRVAVALDGKPSGDPASPKKSPMP